MVAQIGFVWSATYEKDQLSGQPTYGIDNEEIQCVLLWLVLVKFILRRLLMVGTFKK